MMKTMMMLMTTTTMKATSMMLVMMMIMMMLTTTTNEDTKNALLNPFLIYFIYSLIFTIYSQRRRAYIQHASSGGNDTMCE